MHVELHHQATIKKGSVHAQNKVVSVCRSNIHMDGTHWCNYIKTVTETNKLKMHAMVVYTLDSQWQQLTWVEQTTP